MTVGKKAIESADVAAVLGRYQRPFAQALREAVDAAERATPRDPASDPMVSMMYGQLGYHLGWRSATMEPEDSPPGKLLRPTIVLLTAELAGGVPAIERAMPAAVAIEMIHNFSLIHDDIEDGDTTRRQRPTLWRLWGQAQAINTGDALFSLARKQFWGVLRVGVAPEVAVGLAERLDAVCLELCEGQHLDMSFEGRRDVTVAMYLDMIARKTAALIRLSAQTGATLAAPRAAALVARLGEFGQALGLAFQLRDDLLGIWHATTLGKTYAGDVRRKKMSLPAIHALEHAGAADRRALARIYSQPGAPDDEQVEQALGILERSGARARVHQELRAQISAARAALDAALTEARDLQRAAPNGEANESSARTAAALATLLDYVSADAGA